MISLIMVSQNAIPWKICILLISAYRLTPIFKLYLSMSHSTAIAIPDEVVITIQVDPWLLLLEDIGLIYW